MNTQLVVDSQLCVETYLSSASPQQPVTTGKVAVHVVRGPHGSLPRLLQATMECVGSKRNETERTGVQFNSSTDWILGGHDGRISKNPLPERYKF